MHICRRMSCRNLLLLSLLITFLLRPYILKAQLYKYIDVNGVIHYSDKPFSQGRVIYSKDSIGNDNDINMDSTDEMFVDNIIYRASRLFEIDPALIKAIIKVESDFNPDAVSRAGAQGLMQLMPITAYNMDVTNPFDPEENIIGGTRYFKYLLDRFNNDLKVSLAAYNAGETTVIKNGGNIPRYKETRGFIKKVIKYYSHYKDQLLFNDSDDIIQYTDAKNVLHITNTSGPFLEKIYP